MITVINYWLFRVDSVYVYMLWIEHRCPCPVLLGRKYFRSLEFPGNCCYIWGSATFVPILERLVWHALAQRSRRLVLCSVNRERERQKDFPMWAVFVCRVSPSHSFSLPVTENWNHETISVNFFCTSRVECKLSWIYVSYIFHPPLGKKQRTSTIRSRTSERERSTHLEWQMEGWISSLKYKISPDPFHFAEVLSIKTFFIFIIQVDNVAIKNNKWKCNRHWKIFDFYSRTLSGNMFYLVKEAKDDLCFDGFGSECYYKRHLQIKVWDKSHMQCVTCVLLDTSLCVTTPWSHNS